MNRSKDYALVGAIIGLVFAYAGVGEGWAILGFSLFWYWFADDGSAA